MSKLYIPRGTRIRIVYLIPGVNRKKHEVVADALDADDHQLHISGRPLFGTSSIPIHYIHEIWETDREIEEPHIYRGETRLL